MESVANLPLENEQPGAPRNMRGFLVIWFGQLVSLLGSGLTSFALGVWLYEQTGRATPFALTVLFGNLPRILLSPVAEVVRDSAKTDTTELEDKEVALEGERTREPAPKPSPKPKSASHSSVKGRS